MLPAESAGYFRISLIICLVSEFACFKILLTMLAGISSTISTVSSMYSSSTTSFSSLSEKLFIRYSLCSADISTNVSEARSFGRILNKSGIFCSGTSSNIPAISTACIVRRISRTDEYFLFSIRVVTVFARVNFFSSINFRSATKKQYFMHCRLLSVF